MEIYKFTAKDNKGDTVSLNDYAGKVLLIVNTATQCGFTPQYSDLQALYAEFADQGFVVLDFPCNQFGGQAPGSDAEIASFCETKFGVTFPAFSKVEVNGENAHPLFKYLTGETSFGGFDSAHPIASVLEDMLGKADPDYGKKSDIKWNFTKFLIDRRGNIVQRFEPTTDIALIRDKVRELL